MRRAIALAMVAGGVMLSPAMADPQNSLNKPTPGAPRVAVGDRGMAIMSAALNADATIARGEGVTSSAKLGTGTYEVAFGRDITACVYQVSPGEPGVGGAGGKIVGVTQRSGNPLGLFITMRSDANVLTDSGFFVLVYCGR